MPSYPLLRQGDHLPTVGILQKLLNRTGLRVTAAAAPGPRTRAALIQFQSGRRLPRDGIAGPQTWERLVSIESLPVLDCIDVFDPMLMTDVQAVTDAGSVPIVIGGMSGGVARAA